MRRPFVYLLSIFLFINITEGISQPNFASSYLEKLYEMLPLDCKNFSFESFSSNIFTAKSDDIIASREVEIKYYLKKNKVEDIGITIIDSISMSLFPTDILYRFIERKILELLLIQSDNLLVEKLKEDKIVLLIDQYPIFSIDMLYNAFEVMSENRNFKLLRDSLRYELNWTNYYDTEVTFSFPATNTLITAKDKKELDDVIYQQLKDFDYSWNLNENYHLDDFSVNELEFNNNIYSTTGQTFYIPEINNTLYLKRDGEKLKYIYEPNYLAESLSNLIQNPQLNNQLYIHLKHRTYGYEEINYTIRLSDLIGYFKSSCSFYTGIEKQTENGIEAIVIIQNRLLNFIHLLVLKLNKSDLFKMNKTLYASFHTNIPTENIQNLFEEYEPQKNQFKLKLN